MSADGKRKEFPPPVMPFTGDVDAVEPPTVETVGPLVDSVDSEVPIVEPVAPVFDVDAPEEKPAAKTPRKSESS